MHVDQFLCDWMLWAVLLFRQPLDTPDFRKELANLFLDVLAILLGHNVTASGTIPKRFRVSGG